MESMTKERQIPDKRIIKFRKVFSDDESCRSFLADYKWQADFECRNCGNTNYCKGKTAFSRRCTKCKKEESATAHTLFHRCKIPLAQAFEMAYLVCRFPDISSYDINRKLGIRHMTCFSFQKRIQSCQDKPEISKMLDQMHKFVTKA